jgi:hypothetical protein
MVGGFPSEPFSQIPIYIFLMLGRKSGDIVYNNYHAPFDDPPLSSVYRKQAESNKA